ncbi:MAG: hypothetical protein VXW88_05515 [Pseudomonadota bacterium]|nr:hypothetical protein [Pseudomonadota bacterium]
MTLQPQRSRVKFYIIKDGVTPWYGMGGQSDRDAKSPSRPVKHLRYWQFVGMVNEQRGTE